MQYPQDFILVQTNMGTAYRNDGAWFIWDVHNGFGSFRKYPRPQLFKTWEPLVEEDWMKLPTAKDFSFHERLNSQTMLGIDARMRAPKKIGWFRPIYYFLPVLGSLLGFGICLYLWQVLESPFYQWVAAMWLPVMGLQLFNAKRQYDDWVFNWEMLQVAEEFSAAVARLRDIDWVESFWPEPDADDSLDLLTKPTLS